jgi:hypothetical protein
MRVDSVVPPGLGLMLFGYPRVPLRSTLGYFPRVPSGKFVGRGLTVDLRIFQEDPLASLEMTSSNQSPWPN